MDMNEHAVNPYANNGDPNQPTPNEFRARFHRSLVAPSPFRTFGNDAKTTATNSTPTSTGSGQDLVQDINALRNMLHAMSSAFAAQSRFIRQVVAQNDSLTRSLQEAEQQFRCATHFTTMAIIRATRSLSFPH